MLYIPMFLSSLPVPVHTKFESRRLSGNNKLAGLVVVDYHPLNPLRGHYLGEDQKFTSKNKTSYFLVRVSRLRRDILSLYVR